MPKANPPSRELLEYATGASREKLELWIELGSSEKAAKALGVTSSVVREARYRVERAAAKKGFTPEADHSRFIPEGQKYKGQSVMVDEEGNVKLRWIKTDEDKQRQEEALKEFIAALCEDVVPAKPTKTPKGKFDSNLLSAIFIGDAHLGMYAYGKETKHSDFDTDIAVQGLRDAVDDLVDRAPNSETCLIVDVGDFMHQNGTAAKTAKGTDLDVDSRYPRVLRLSGKVMRYIISRALDKFKKVVVVISRGNHNQDPAIAVQEILSAYFHNEPRVQVLDTDGYFHYLEWGKWLIGVNHGDKIRPAKLVNVMARDMAAAWGRTSHRMWALGHYHHEHLIELEGCTVHRFGALPPPDAWHASSGYGGDGQMQMITFRKEGGKHSTLVYDVPRPIIEPDVVIE